MGVNSWIVFGQVMPDVSSTRSPQGEMRHGFKVKSAETFNEHYVSMTGGEAPTPGSWISVDGRLRISDKGGYYCTTKAKYCTIVPAAGAAPQQPQEEYEEWG